MGILKGKTAIKIFKSFSGLKKKPYWGNHFWSRGYCSSTIGLDEEKVRKFVQYQETQEKLQALQKTAPAPGAAAGAAILSKEQQAEVDRFRKTAAEKRRELKEVRKDLRADSEALQFWVKVMNIALIPALLVLMGVSLMIYRRRSTR